ncbi:P-loop ATPase, Sll1717 family [Vibrio vulnificus]
MYFCQLVINYLQSVNLCNGGAKEVRERLVEVGLIQESNTLKRLLNGAALFAKKLTNVESIEGSGNLAEASISGRITFRTPSHEESLKGIRSVDELIACLNEHLEHIGKKCWILCDRLDVAFDESLELEKNALRALFKVYRDIEEYGNISIKVFLRDDIWARITKEGFREASHITRTTTISWDSKNLLNLVVRRALCNSELVNAFSVVPQEIMDDHDKQKEFYYKIFPKQVDLGEKKSETFEWINNRIRDGLTNTPPRELIHYYNEIISQEERDQAIGNNKIEEPNIVSRSAIKSAAGEVSKVRLEQTIFAEHPDLKESILALENKKAEHDLSTLRDIWGLTPDQTKVIASKLADIGFFENRAARNDNLYKIPFIYRPYLNIIQGKAF